MSIFWKKALVAIVLAVCLGVVVPLPARSAVRMGAQYAAGTEGFSLAYRLPVIGSAAVDLAEPGDSDNVTIRVAGMQLATLRFELVDIHPDNSTLDVGIELTSPLDPDSDMGAVVPLPFGSAELGTTMAMLGRRLAQIGGHDIDIAALVRQDEVRYRAVADLPPIIEALELEGTAVDNVLEIEIPGLATVVLQFQPASMFTQVWYSITLAMPVFSAGGDDDGFEPQPMQGGPIPVPYANYHVWCDVDIDLEELMGPQL